VFDVVVGAALLCITTPVMLLVAALVRLTLGAPVLFRQTRPGLHSAPFNLIKFRTMSDARGPDGTLLTDAQRLTRVGRWLRRTSLDELPELVNVLRGDMSLVGPRPLLMQYLQRYTRYQARRHEMPPGITGLAQVRGRNSLNWEQRFDLDVWYVDHWSFSLDLRILLLTIVKVIGGDGVSQPGSDTSDEFMGSPPGRGTTPPRWSC
jgi:lipopolysaccharide/colanic/teichoic acid biosynthesis glycosyltransferase